MSMAWYVATIILKCEVEQKPTTDGEWTCIQQIHLLRAPNQETAYQNAIKLGISQEHSYLNMQGEKVTWRFVGLENLEELDTKTIRDGTEIWGSVFYTESPEALVVEKHGLSVFFNESIANLTAEEILKDGFESRLVCNRVKNQ